MKRSDSPLYGRAMNAAAWMLLGVAGSIVALQDPLFSENQNTKFLHAAAKTGYRLLGDDWMANTIDPLPMFSALVEALFRFGAIKAAYLLFPLLIAIFIFSLVSIADRLYGIRKSGAALAIFLGIVFVEFKNLQLGFGTQYLIGHYLQPCVFGVFITLAVERHLSGARMWASAFLALAAAFHPAYMPSALLIQGSFTLLDIIREKRVDLQVVAPLMLFIALSAPLVVRYKLLFAWTTPETGTEAMRLLSTERIAVHTKVRSWLNYEDYANMALIVVSMAMARKTPLFWIMLPLAGVIAVTVPLLYFVSWPSLEVLTPWRTSVILLPLAWTVIAGRVAALAMRGAERSRIAGYALLAIGTIAVAVPVVQHMREQVHSLFETGTGSDNAVMDWAGAHASKGDLWLVPNRTNAFERFRMRSGVPILVNWKTHPYKDTEILEWYRRNKAAEAFYRQAATPEGPALLLGLARTYGITFAVLPQPVPSGLYDGMPIVMQNESWAVVRLGDNGR